MAKKIIVNALHTKTGGGLVFFNHIIPLIAKNKGLSLTVVAHEKYVDRLSIPKNVTLHKVNFKDGFINTLLWEQCTLPRLIRSLKGEATFNLANYSALLAPKNVLFVTNNPEVRHFVPFRQKIYWYFLIWMTRLSLIFANKAISNGVYMKKVYASGLFSFLQSKMVKATTACDILLKGKVKKKQSQLIAIGDFYKHKDYPTLLKALSFVKERVGDVQLLIIGRDISAQVRQEMKTLVENLGIEDHVTFKGVLPHDQVQRYLAESMLYVSPSDAEAFSLTLLEAMTLGTASIVKDHAFQKEVAEDAGAYYVPVSGHIASSRQEAPAALFADAILTLLHDKKQREKIEKEGQKIAAKTSWKKTAAVIEQVLLDA